MKESKVCLTWLFETGKYCPHRRHFQSMGGDMFSFYAFFVVVLLIDLNLFVPLRDVGDIDLHRTIAKSFHKLIVLKLTILGLVGVSNDDLINISLRKFLGLNLVLLRSSKQVIKKSDIELQYFDKLNHAAIRDVKLPIKVKGSWIGVRAKHRNFSVIQIACEFRRILILFIFGLKGGNPLALLFRKFKTTNHDVFENLFVIAFVVIEQNIVDESAEWVEIPFNSDAVLDLSIAIQLL